MSTLTFHLFAHPNPKRSNIQKDARALRAPLHSLTQMVSKTIAVIRYKGKRCAAHSGLYNQTIDITIFILDCPLYFI